jgi:hypothetical protein
LYTSVTGVNENLKVFFGALPTTELNKNNEERLSVHYLLKKISIEKLELLNETFKDLIAKKTGYRYTKNSSCV